MKILRILNNNAVSVIDRHQYEQIVCGPGIGFQQKKGAVVDKSKIRQTFALQNTITQQQLQHLLANIPLKYITVANTIVKQARLKLGKPLNESLLISLADHIYMTLKRHADDIVLTNVLAWDIQRFYPDEFRIGVKALTLIKQQFNVDLSIDEAAFIANHIINAELTTVQDDVGAMTELMQSLTNIVKYFFKIEFNAANVGHYRFITHLKFFTQRVLAQQQLGSTADELLPILATQYPNSFECVQRMATYLDRRYAYHVSVEEQSYLIIHIQRLIYQTS